MYDGVITSVRIIRGETNIFSIIVGLHQEVALNPYLFALVINDITRHIQDEVPRSLLFADDIVSIDGLEMDITIN